MKLGPDQIKNIEAILTMYESGVVQRAIIIKHNIRDLPALNGFLSVMRTCGVSLVTTKGRTALSDDDAVAFADWLEARRIAERMLKQ